MSVHFRTLVAAALVLSAGALCFAADQIDNPQYKMWARFKPGTSVTLKSENDMAGNKSESETTTTLVDLNPDKAVIETKMSINAGGNKMDMPARKMDVPAKIDKPADTTAANTPPNTNTQKPDVKESSETIDVAGKSCKCNVIESKSDANGMTTVTKSWTCQEIPGGLAKMETTMDGAMKGTTKLSVSAMTIK